MSASNGVIRVGTKGRKKCAIGDENDPRKLPVFEVDVVEAFQEWIVTDEGLRDAVGTEDRSIPSHRMAEYHRAAVDFVMKLMTPVGQADSLPKIDVAEAMDFIARLREQYDELADFFLPRKRGEGASPATSEPGFQFSEEPDPSPTSTS